MQKTSRPSRDIDTDRPGRGYNPMGQHHPMDSPSDSHREEKRRFADLLANHINAAALDRSYDRLILVAPPKPLGDLRQSLSKEAPARSDEHTSEHQSLMGHSIAS